MAAGNFTLLNIAKLKILSGAIDLDSHAFAMVLTDKDQVLSATFAGTSTDARYSDLTDEVSNGSGYTTGGKALTGVTLTRSVGTVKWDCDDITWTALTKTFKYGVIVDTTNANDDILGFFDFDTTSSTSEISISAADFTVQISASGVFTAA